jgi:hypothetical protein
MNYGAQILGIKENEAGTYLKVLVPEESIQAQILKFRNGNAIDSEIRINDGRIITADQRKKIYATIKDICEYTGDVPEYLKEFLKFEYCAESGEDYFSLSNCSITTARMFINHTIDFILMHDIPLSEAGLERTDDIDHYLWGCIKYKKCCICGKPADLHHWDALGVGRNRKHFNDSQNRKIALCRMHHYEAHTIGRDTFADKHHVYGVIYKEDE